MSNTQRQVSALCVHPKGHYQNLLGVDNCWDEQRDAHTYNLDTAVVAHPPCGPWGRLAHLCTQQDQLVAHHCVRMVRRNGGVLEHPAHSRLWDAEQLPQPGQFPDQHGGITLETTLAAFGAPVKKKTWIYVCRPTTQIQLPYRTTPITRTVDSLPSWRRQITPMRMATWLINLAQTTTPTRQMQCN